MFFIQVPLSCERIFFLHYFGNPRTQEDGYEKYRISNPSRKRRRRETDNLKGVIRIPFSIS